MTNDSSQHLFYSKKAISSKAHTGGYGTWVSCKSSRKSRCTNDEAFSLKGTWTFCQFLEKFMVNAVMVGGLVVSALDF